MFEARRERRRNRQRTGTEPGARRDTLWKKAFIRCLRRSANKSEGDCRHKVEIGHLGRMNFSPTSAPQDDPEQRQPLRTKSRAART